MDGGALPKVTPYLLRRADTMCERRLAKSFAGDEASPDPVHRSRLRDAFLATAREAHAELRCPEITDFDDIAPDLEPEERAVLAQAAHWYVALFGGRAVRYEDHGLDTPTVSPSRAVRVGGWVDLAVVDADGAKELRQLSLWDGARVPSDPLELESVRTAVLRLSKWAADGPVRVVWADLVSGIARERVVDTARERSELAGWLDDRLQIVRDRTREPVAGNGEDCRGCGYVAACPEHRNGAHYGSRRDFLPGIVSLTPTALDSWNRCRRDWRNAYVLSIPSSDHGGNTVHGQQVHDLLRFIHGSGSCRDDAHVRDALEANGFEPDTRVHVELANHARRCPADAIALGHEITRARFHRKPMPPFMATARIDALWVHDGMLDARDYKTGQVWSEQLSHDRQARLQAWVLAPIAQERGLRLRIAFEHLSPDVREDPEPFEPDADDLDAIEEELRATVEAMRADTEYRGISDLEVCRTCRYRSICPDSAVPGLPVWPMVDAEDAPDSMES
jgi:hypothetical protein